MTQKQIQVLHRGKMVKKVNVFIGSPSDCIDVRDHIKTIIENTVNVFAESHSVEFKPITWDQSGVMGVGSPQKLINQELLHEAQIVILIFWHKIGIGHTIEELNEALRLKKEILLFFKTEPKEINGTAELEELREVMNLKERIANEGKLFYRKFRSNQELERILMEALKSKIEDYTYPSIPDLPPNPPKLKQLSPPKIANQLDWKEELKEVEGFASFEDVFAVKKLPGQVFSIELLAQPLVLYVRGGKKIVEIDRRNVSNALYTNSAKAKLCEVCFKDSAMKSWANEVEKEVHDFFLGKSPYEKIKISLDKLPFRWASGGVFPVVKYKNDIWTPFFFRDIKPFGWNIPLGASEKSDHLNDPWTFLWREFFEEFLVLCQKPEYKFDNNGEISPINYKLPNDRILTTIPGLAEQCAQSHIELRKKCDHLTLNQSTEDIECNIHRTNSVLSIILRNGRNTWSDVLVAINPMELGIEVVAVVTFNLDDDDYVLDGEIIEPQGGIKELVRMPIALISHRYLKKAFGNGDLKYQGDIQPSVEGEPIPKEEFVLFDWDIQRRKIIAIEPKLGEGFEQKRYLNCFRSEIFGDFFKNPENGANIPSLFTPTSAKIVSYYFSNSSLRN